MLTALVVAAVLVVLLIAAVAATHDGDLLVDAPADAADIGLPDLMVQPEDIAEVRFGMTLRGYRMSEVDRVLDRLARELAGRDAQIATLQQAVADARQPVEPVAAAEHRTPWRTPAPNNPAPEVVAWSRRTAAEPEMPPAVEEPAPVVEEPAAVEEPLVEPEPEPEAAASTSWWEPQPPRPQAEATEAAGGWDDFPEVLALEEAPEGLADAEEPPTRVAGSPAPPAEPRAWSAPAFPSAPPEEASPSGDGTLSP
ncbi:MAG: hypothetical protein JWO12_1037 [Frankiales bacterium]|nr:hypothetical protein [Frankiales bacterium]